MGMVTNYHRLSVSDVVRSLRDRRFSAVALTETALHLAETEGKRLNAVLAVCREKALAQAEKIDGLISQGRDIPPLAGVPVIVKDNIVYSGYPTTCAGRILDGFVSPYDATAVERLEQAGAVVIAKANMDEFAMGSSNEHSAFGPVISPIRNDLVPGGSSGGSCAVVAAGIVPIALGSDTGGSVRQPAGFCGVVGLKPTYGAISRYGLVAFASSTDQIGPIARTVADCAAVFETISGYDERDATSAQVSYAGLANLIESGYHKPCRFGIPREFISGDLDEETRAAVRAAIDKLESAGHELVEVSLPHTDLAVAAYYIIADAEASSNLARFDGVRYGATTGREKGLATMYAETRRRGFGREVMRRIMLGTFALSAGYYEAYYHKAQQVRELIRRDFERVFETADILVSPTSPTAAFKRGERIDDPLAMYMSDVLTAPASLAGIPAISIPCGRTRDGRPIGLQMMAPAFGETGLLVAARQVERLLGAGDAGH